MEEEKEAKVLNGIEPPQEVVYVKERPFLKLLVGGAVIVISIIAFLWMVGFAMSFSGVRPPTFDKQIVKDQWDKTTGDPASSYADCVTKGGSITETFPTSCSFAGDTFTESIEDACLAEPTHELCVSEVPASGAKETGKALGKKYNDAKEISKDFLDGFKEETTVDETTEKWTEKANKALQDAPQ